MASNGVLLNFVIEKLSLCNDNALNENNILINIEFDTIELNIPFQKRSFEFLYNTDQLAEKIKKIPLRLIFGYKDTGKIITRIGEATCKWPKNVFEKLCENDFDNHSCVLNSCITHDNHQIGNISITVMLCKICAENSESLPDQSLFSEDLMKPYLNDLQKCSKDILFFIDEHTNVDIIDSRKRNLSCNTLINSPESSNNEIQSKNFIPVGIQGEVNGKEAHNRQTCENIFGSPDITANARQYPFDICNSDYESRGQRKLYSEIKDEICESDKDRVKYSTDCKSCCCTVCGCGKFYNTKGNVMQKNTYQEIVRELQALEISNCCCKLCYLKRRFFKHFKKYLSNFQTGKKNFKSTIKFQKKLFKIVNRIHNQYKKTYSGGHNRKECSVILKKKSMLKKKNLTRKIYKFNIRKKSVHVRNYSYNVGDTSRVTSVGHKYCTTSIPPVPANMGWMWNTDIEANQLGWKPGAVTLPVKKIMSYFLGDYPIDNLPVSTNKKEKSSQLPVSKEMYSQIYLTEKNGEYVLNIHPPNRETCTCTANKTKNINRKNLQRKLSRSAYKSNFCRGSSNGTESGLNINLIQVDNLPENTVNKNIDCICTETQYEDGDWNIFKN